jgi:methionyl-tRNA synthetase
MKKCYITTPIYYPNAEPHLGSAYTTIIADFTARVYRSIGYKTYFLTGLDEHGEKIERTAKEKGIKPKELVDSIALIFKKTWQELDITYDHFIRTTDEEHKAFVKEFLQKVKEKGDIYYGNYEGYYCVGCERYYTEKELINDKDGFKCPLHLKLVEKKIIPSYFFKLSKYKEKLLNFYDKNPGFIVTGNLEQIKNSITELKDLSISRPKEQVSWGIEMPFDNSHVTYVWFDALLNYLSASKGFWPPDIQIIGKDILWFHAVIWPAMLMSLNYELPRKLFSHGFLTVNAQKMSKSLGNVINPVELAKEYSVDTLRYYLITKIAFGDDGDFSTKSFKDVHNNELIGSYGNLANRLAKLYNTIGFDQEIYKKEKFDKIINELELKAGNYDLLGIIKLYNEKILPVVDEINAYLNKEEPWKKKENSKKVIGKCLNAFFNISVLLSPLIPHGTYKITKGKTIKEIKENKEIYWIPESDNYVLYKKVE